MVWECGEGQTDRHTDGCGHYTFRLGYASRRNGYGLSYCLYRPDALPAAKPTVSKHCRQNVISNFLFICSSNSVSETIVVNNLIWWLTWLWCDDWRGSDVMVHVTLMRWLTWLSCDGWHGSDVMVDVALMWLMWLWCDGWRDSDVMVDVILMWWLMWLWCDGWHDSNVMVDMTLMWWLTWLWYDGWHDSDVMVVDIKLITWDIYLKFALKIYTRKNR